MSFMVGTYCAQQVGCKWGSVGEVAVFISNIPVSADNGACQRWYGARFRRHQASRIVAGHGRNVDSSNVFFNVRQGKNVSRRVREPGERVQHEADWCHDKLEDSVEEEDRHFDLLGHFLDKGNDVANPSNDITYEGDAIE